MKTNSFRKTNNKPIGIFDSGIGGLTVLEKIHNRFPNEKYIYLGDTFNCPYGTKSKTEIMSCVSQAIKFLEKNSVKMIIIGCNTATVNSYELKSNIPIIRIIEPTAKTALALKKKHDPKGKIIVLATNYTIDAQGYEKFLGNEMFGVRSSDFVIIAEEGKQNTKYSEKICKKVMKNAIGKGKTVILGCTHFGLLEKDIKKVLGEDILTVESSECVVDDVGKCLQEVGFNERGGGIKIFVTGEPEKVKIGWFNKEYDGIHKVRDY